MGSEDIGNGDTDDVCHMKDMKSVVLRLQNDRQLLSEKLSEIMAKNNALRDKLVRKKSRTTDMTDTNRRLLDQLSRLKSESLALDENTRRLETNIKESRHSIGLLSSQLVAKLEKQSNVLNDMSGQMYELSQQFYRMTITSNSKEPNKQKKKPISDQISRVEQQIRSDFQKRLLLLKELNQIKNDSNDDCDEDVDPLGLDYKWSDWPIRHRLMAYQLFNDENKLFVEDFEFIERQKH